MPTSERNLPDVLSTDAECRLWSELRNSPELLLAVAQETGSELSRQTRLRKIYPEALVRIALSLHELRMRAGGKFSRAQQMWFDRVGLEQSTAELVAQHKAKRFPQNTAVWDLCSGIGSDSIALAQRTEVIAVDSRPVACLWSAWNADVYGVGERHSVRCEDVQSLTLQNALLHIDPDRRASGAPRSNRLEDYQPGVEYLKQLMDANRGGAIKVGPASNFGGQFPEAEVELISLQGECKEATIWFGELAGPDLFRATVLPSGETLAGHPLATAVPVTALNRFIYDPDPAVVRAGLVDLCAEKLGLTRLDAAEEYLTGAVRVASPFVTPFEVIAELPNNEKGLRRFLRETPYRSYEIKCRHVPVQAETLRRKLPVGGEHEVTIVLARIQGQTRWIIARRVS